MKFLYQSLPETSNLPSVFMFAECILSGTQQTRSLPSATLKTLGKEEVCRVFFLHSAKRSICLSVFVAALGKELVRRVPEGIHSANIKTLGKFENSGSGWLQRYTVMDTQKEGVCPPCILILTYFLL